MSCAFCSQLIIVILRALQIKVGPGALAIDFPAPSGLVAYELLPDASDRTDLELGLQHLKDSNPRPYVRVFVTRRTADGRASLSGGWIAADTARYIYGNEARYHGIDVVPRIVLKDRWQITTFASRYEQTYQADAGFIPARGVTLPELDRLHYIGQRWSQFDTRNENHGLIVSTAERDGAWDFSLSSLLSSIDRPRSDFNIFRNVQADGTADAAVVVARDRRVSSWAHEVAARRDWIDDEHRTELTAIATAFEIEKPEPGFDSNNEYRYLTTAQHRGVEASVAAALTQRSRVVLGALWMRPRLSGEPVTNGAVTSRPLGRSSRVASIGFDHQLAWPAGLSLDVDASYSSAKLASIDGAETTGYVLANVGARYRFPIADAATTVRLRIYNATNEYAWYTSSSGIQSYEPERRVMLSVAVGM